MSGLLKEFKNFLFRGNLLDLATAVVLGVAFNAVVQSFVTGIVTPFIAALGGQPDFSSMTIDIGKSAIAYGSFLNALLYFVIVAAVIFVMLKAASQAQKLRATTDVADTDAPPPSDEALLLAEIRDLLRAGRWPST
ncbi:MAG: large conductance mechanosensitive channel [Actinomycetota bacterium]|jgi:large conductance mechanosensitive channel